MRSLFKELFLSCAPCRKKQIAPKISPSPPAPSSPKPVLNRAPSTKKTLYGSEPSTLVKSPRDLRRAASAMEGRSYKASAFARSRTMSLLDIRRSDSIKMTKPIIFSTSNGNLKPQQMEMELHCTLDELCFGCVKQIEVSRDVISNGVLNKKEELLMVNVEPGWTKGTMITFPGWEYKERGKISGDVIFIVVEKEHERIKRQHKNDEDLEIEIGLSLVDAIAGCNLSIPLLGGEEMIMTIDEIVDPGFERVIKGQGMPKAKDLSQRGDLKIKFHVEFPKSLTDSQRSEIFEILSE